MITAERTNTGDDQLEIRAADIPEGLNFARGTDHAVGAVLLRKLGKAQDLFLGGAFHTNRFQIRIIHAGQYRDTEDQGPLVAKLGGGIGGRPDHGRAAARMNGQHGRLDKFRRGADAPGNRVGDIVELEIEKERGRFPRNGHDALRTVGGEKLLPQLEPTRNRGDGAAKGNRRLQISCVNGSKNGILGRLSHVHTSCFLRYRWKLPR